MLAHDASQALIPRNSRVVIDSLRPAVDEGRFPIKRVLGDKIRVESILLCDGHDSLKGNLLFRFSDETIWQKVPLKPLWNDIWQAEFSVDRLGLYVYTVEASIDRYQTYVEDIKKKFLFGEPIANALLLFLDYLAEVNRNLPVKQTNYIDAKIFALKKQVNKTSQPQLYALLDDPLLIGFCKEIQDDSLVKLDRELTVSVEPEIAICSSWYELFPRSTSPTPNVYGTLDDCAKRLPYIANLGFDIVYLPPIHPIGESFRKGKNGAQKANPFDVGSPWAIGNREGGHKAIDPRLGDFTSFQKFLGHARNLKLEVALDLAFQCAPDHPYVKEHPEWFKKNPDGTIQYAENPPKKYQDIVPFDFECHDKDALFHELLSVVLFWIEKGIHIFRVDNPHTKPFYFWQWLIEKVKARYPNVVFLSEAFTRPHMMARLAKIGFSQSYTYFTWRNTKAELTEYLTELTQTDLAEYFFPNFWPNTPDILSQALQNAPSSSFIARLVLASTLSASYGIYGPAFEMCENKPKEEGSEEYLDSEKYELRRWNLSTPSPVASVISRINRIRKENSALHRNSSLRFHTTDNESLIAYSKMSEDSKNIIVVVVNLNPSQKQSATLTLPLDEFGIDPEDTYQLHDLLSDNRFFWQGSENKIEIDPQVMPACIFQLMRKARSEEEFEYYA